MSNFQKDLGGGARKTLVECFLHERIIVNRAIKNSFRREIFCVIAQSSLLVISNNFAVTTSQIHW